MTRLARMRLQQAVRALAWNHAITRTTLATGLLASPSTVGRSWLGDGIDTGGGDVALRALAIRDLVIGVGTLSALRSGAPVRRWFQLGVAVECVELAAIRRRKKELGPAADKWTAVTALGAIGGAVIALALRDEP